MNTPPTIAPMIDLAERIDDVPGDFIEFGVFRARSFSMLLPIAMRQGKLMHGVDSFEGMDHPGEFDILEDGKDLYPKGRFANGGLLEIRGLLGGFPESAYRLHKGFVPQVLDTLPDMELSLAFLDLDHYEPTKAAIAWAWPRINTGGLMICDDFVVGTDRLSTRAINEFIADRTPRLVRINRNRVAFVKAQDYEP